MIAFVEKVVIHAALVSREDVDGLKGHVPRGAAAASGHAGFGRASLRGLRDGRKRVLGILHSHDKAVSAGWRFSVTSTHVRLKLCRIPPICPQ
jgi:hypothetical protein